MNNNKIIRELLKEVEDKLVLPYWDFKKRYKIFMSIKKKYLKENAKG